jgi:site-specific DNA-methyltransferase (adenine-specific)
VDELVARIEAEREVVGTSKGVSRPGFAGETYGPNGNLSVKLDITTPATDAAKQWEGWGTALKPAHEIIVLARRPLIGTVAANVLTHGTGALNIDGARVGYASEADQQRMSAGVDSIRERGGVIEGSWKNSSDLSGANPASERGRWPANVIFNTEAGALLDEQADGASRFFTAIEWDDNTDIGIDVPFRYVPKPSKQERNAGLDELPAVFSPTMNDGIGGKPHNSETATPKQNHHPTVKPLALMRWLVKLVTPPGGTVLEPFAGSGTTLMACVLEGFNGIGIEMTDEYLPIIEGRVKWAQAQPPRLDL